MERRGFLRGILASIAGSEAMVRLASPVETQALVAQQPVILRQPDPVPVVHEAMSYGAEVFVRSEAGRFVPIGVITRIEISHDVEHIDSMDGTVCLMPGLWRGEAEFQSFHPMQWAAAIDTMQAPAVRRRR